MAIDSVQKRMAAMNLTCPWRGALIYPPEPGFQIGQRAAGVYLYSLASAILQSVKFTLRAIPQVGWNKLKAQPATKFKVQTLNDD